MNLHLPFLSSGQATSRTLRREWRSSLARRLDWLDILDSTIPLVDGRVAVGLELYPFAADALTAGQRNSAYLAVRDAFARLPEQTHVQLFHRNWYATPEDVRCEMRERPPSGNPEIDEIVGRRQAFLEGLASGGFLYEPRSYLFVTFSPSATWKLDAAERAGKRGKRRLSTGVAGTRRIVRRFAEEHARMLEDVGLRLESVETSLRSAGLQSRRLGDEELAGLLHSELNPRDRASGIRRSIDRRVLTEPFNASYYLENPWARPPSLREQLVGSDVIRKHDRIEVDGIRTRSLYLKTLPEHAVPGMIESVTSGLHFEYSLALNIRVTSRAEELARLRDRKKMHDSMKSAWIHNIKLDTAESEIAGAQIDSLIYDTIEGRDRPLSAGLVVTFEGRSDSELASRTSTVIDRIRGMHSAEALHDRYRSIETWISGLPAHGHSDERLRETTLTCAAALAPVFGRYRGTSSWPVRRESSGWPLICAPNDRGELVTIDPAETRTRHCAIWGATNSGKSVFALQMMLRHARHPGARTYVIDATGTPYETEDGIGESPGSYERMAKIARGEFVAVGPDMPCFNPFAMRMPPDELGDSRTDSDGVPLFAYIHTLAFLKALLVDETRPAIDKATEAVLFEVLKNLMRARPDPDDPPFMDRFLKELHAASLRNDRARDCFEALRLYGPGTPFGDFLSRKDRRFNSRSPFVIFDLSRLKEFGRDAGAMLVLVVNWIETEMQRSTHREARKLIVADELHDYVRGPMGETMVRFAKTLRKRNGTLVYISQDLADLTSWTAGQALISNTGTKIILGLEDRVDTYREQYKLTEADCDLIDSLGGRGGGGEVTATRAAFVKCGNKRTRLTLPLEPVEYYITTSDPKDVSLMRACQDAIGRPGRDLTYLRFFDLIASRYPPGWTSANDVEGECARLRASAATRTRREP